MECALSLLHLSSSATLCQILFLVQGVRIEKYVSSVPQSVVPLQVYGQYQSGTISELPALFHPQVWVSNSTIHGGQHLLCDYFFPMNFLMICSKELGNLGYGVCS